MKELGLKEISILKREKKKVGFIIVLFIILGLIYTFNCVKPEYKTSTTLILTNTKIENNSFSFDETSQTIQASEMTNNTNLFSTYSEVIKSNTLLEKVKSNLEININIKELQKLITVNRVNDTEVLKITVKNADSKLACDITNEIAKVFSEKIQKYYNINVYVVDPAVVETTPYNINHELDIIIFLGIGIVFSILYIIVISKVDTAIKSEQDIEKEIGLKTLISIPIIKEDKKNQTGLINFENKKSVLLEAYKTLRTNVQFTNVNNKGNKVMLVTSAFSSEGKSHVAANLAIAFAQAGKKVILIDADMKSGRLAKIFNIPNNLGFSNYLSGLDISGMEINERINSFINESAVKNLNIITSGSIPPNPTELLESEKIYELIKDLSVFYDMIILDGAPVLPSNESLILTRVATSTLLVTLCNKTKKDELEKAKKDIQNVGGKIIGVVLNKVKVQDCKNNYENIEKKELKDKNIKKNIISLKSKIIELIKKNKEKKTKLLEKTSSEKQENDTNISEINEIQNYQISDEYIKENVSSVNLDTKNSNSKKNENTKNNITQKKVNNQNNEKQDDDKKTENETREKNSYLVKEKIHEVKEFFKNKFDNIKENFKNLKQKIGEKYKIKKEQNELEKQKREELKKQEQIDKEKEEIILAEIREKEKIEEEKKRIEIEKIREAEKIARREQEEKIAEEREKERKEKEKIKYEEKLRKETLKAELKNKKMQEKEEKKKYREEKKIKQKEEARIQEELLEDNLYPKTKYNKNL